MHVRFFCRKSCALLVLRKPNRALGCGPAAASLRRQGQMSLDHVKKISSRILIAIMTWPPSSPASKAQPPIENSAAPGIQIITWRWRSVRRTQQTCPSVDEVRTVTDNWRWRDSLTCSTGAQAPNKNKQRHCTIWLQALTRQLKYRVPKKDLSNR